MRHRTAWDPDSAVRRRQRARVAEVGRRRSFAAAKRGQRHRGRFPRIHDLVDGRRAPLRAHGGTVGEYVACAAGTVVGSPSMRGRCDASDVSGQPAAAAGQAGHRVARRRPRCCRHAFCGARGCALADLVDQASGDARTRAGWPFGRFIGWTRCARASFGRRRWRCGCGRRYRCGRARGRRGSFGRHLGGLRRRQRQQAHRDRRFAFPRLRPRGSEYQRGQQHVQCEREQGSSPGRLRASGRRRGPVHAAAPTGQAGRLSGRPVRIR